MTKKNNKMASYILVKLGLLLAIIALLGQIISVALPWWTYKEVEILGSMYRYHNGLWETCIELDTSVGKAISCSDITDPTDWLTAARALELVGMLLIVLAIVVAGVHLMCMTDIPMLAILGAFIILIAGLFIWIGALIYGYRYVESPGQETSNFHACWGLAMAASILCHISGILLVVGKIFGYD